MIILQELCSFHRLSEYEKYSESQGEQKLLAKEHFYIQLFLCVIAVFKNAFQIH